MKTLGLGSGRARAALSFSSFVCLVACSCAIDPGPVPSVDAASHDAGRAPPQQPRDAGQDARRPEILGATPFAIDVKRGTYEVRAGHRAWVIVEVQRREGFEEPVEVVAWGLPEGVTATMARATPHDQSVVLTLSLDWTTVRGDHPFTITASAEGWTRTRRVLLRVR